MRETIKKKVLSNSEIFKALIDHKRRAIDKGEVGIVREFRIGTGYGRIAMKRIDAFEISCWPGKGIRVTAYEIKRSVSDFRKEIEQPLKRFPAVIYSNQFYFLAQKGLLPVDEIPIEAGLLEVHPESLRLYHKISAPEREAFPPTWSMFASIARRLSHLEEGYH